MLINDLYTNKTPAVAEQSLNEFAPGQGGGDSGNYFQALASAWYNGTFDSGSLQKGIKSQEDVERLLQRGIVCPDGVTRKFDIGYNSNFDGVVISSDDYYEHADHDETDSRTGKPFGPYDYMEFGGEELDESAKWRDPKYKDQLYTQEKPDYNDTREYDRARWDPKPKGYKGRKEPMAGGEFPRTDPLVKGFGRYGVGEPVSKGPRKGLPSRDQITSLKGSIKDAHGRHTRANLPEGTAGKVVFSGTGANGVKYEIIQSGPTDFMIHANGKHIDTYGSLQRAMSVLKNEVPGLQQGMAEAAGSREKFSDLNAWAAAAKQQGLRVGPANGDSNYSYWAVGKGGEVFGKFVTTRVPQNNHGYIKKQGVAEGQLEFNTPDPVVVVQDLKGNILDKINLSVAAQKYKLGAAQNIKNQLAHQNYTTIGNYVIVSPMSGQPQDATTQGVAEGSGPVTHRIGLTVTDPNHPMVSKRGETYQKTVRVTGNDREDAINQAIAHHRRKGYKVHDHHYIGTVDEGIDIDPALAAVAKKYPSAHISKDGKVIQKPVDRPYTPPQQDAEKQQRDLTAKYPNIDDLVAAAERNRDPYYDRAEGSAYYAGREAEQNYQKLKQIQRVIQGLNESLDRSHLP